MKYVCVDLETTGRNPNTCQILEVGMIIVEAGVEVAVFQCFVKHDLVVGEPYALNMNRHIIEKMNSPSESAIMLDTAETAVAIRAFLEKHCGTKRSIVAAGKNFQSFDRKFLDIAVPGIRWSHRCIDPATYFLKQSDEKPPSLAECLQRAGMPDVVTHNALDDCRQVIDLINWGMERMKLLYAS